VEIVDDDVEEDDESFFVDLSNPRSEGKCMVKLGEFPKAMITIIDDDDPGILRFAQSNHALYPGNYDIRVLRVGGWGE